MARGGFAIATLSSEPYHQQNLMRLGGVLFGLLAGLALSAMVMLRWRHHANSQINYFSQSFRQFVENPTRSFMVSMPENTPIGELQAYCVQIQHNLLRILHENRRHATLGQSVLKIIHDLRNMLTTAHLGASRLAEVEDSPRARRLLDSLDRAIHLCERTLDYVRTGASQKAGARHKAGAHREQRQIRQIVNLRQIGLDVAYEGREHSPHVNFVVNAEGQLMADLDFNDIYRILSNLVNNACAAGASEIHIDIRQEEEKFIFEISDDAGGLPPIALDNLFTPFLSSTRSGGTGLGLAIARELAMELNGDLRLVQNGMKSAQKENSQHHSDNFSTCSAGVPPARGQQEGQEIVIKKGAQIRSQFYREKIQASLFHASS